MDNFSFVSLQIDRKKSGRCKKLDKEVGEGVTDLIAIPKLAPSLRGRRRIEHLAYSQIKKDHFNRENGEGETKKLVAVLPISAKNHLFV